MTTDPSQALAWLKALDEGATKGPWRRKPLTYFDDRGKNENHNWNTIDGAECATGYDGGPGGDKTNPWGGQTRDEPEYIALPDASLIAHVRNVLPQLIGVVSAVIDERRNRGTMQYGPHYDNVIKNALTALAEAVKIEMSK